MSQRDRRIGGQGLLTAGVVGLVTTLLAWSAAPLGWPFELTRHFTPHLTVAALVMLAAAALARSPMRAAVAGLAALVFGWAWATAPFKAATPHAGPPALTVAVFNARFDADALARFAVWAEAQPVDILMLAEAQGPSPATLETLFAAWPHSAMSDAEISAGGFRWSTRSAVFSRWPVETTALAREASAQFSRPVIQLDVSHPHGAIQVSGLHPFPPLLPRAGVEQAAMFDAVAEQVPADERFIVMGDLNTTVWSPHYARLPGQRAGDPRLASTFPAALPVGGIAIDHILLGDAFEVVRTQVGPDLGSDHRPVLAAIALSEN